MANRLARWVSILFDSSILSFPIFCAFGWVAAGAAGVGWAASVLLIVTGIPLAYLTLGKRRGWVSDFEMTQRGERPRFIAVSLSSDALALLALCVRRTTPLARDGVDLSLPRRNDVYDFGFLENQFVHGGHRRIFNRARFRFRRARADRVSEFAAGRVGALAAAQAHARAVGGGRARRCADHGAGVWLVRTMAVSRIG
jgi:hypothetical protein